MARSPLVDPEKMPEHYAAEDRMPDGYQQSRHATEGRLQQSPVLRVMANNPEILELHTNAFLDLWREEVTGLTSRETELVIMTVGRTFDSKNEWNSHLSNALGYGVTEDEVLALARGDFDELADKDSALVRYVEAVWEMSVTDELHDELAEHYDDRTIVGIQVLTGYYTLCAVVIDAFGVEEADPGEAPDELGYEALLA